MNKKNGYEVTQHYVFQCNFSNMCVYALRVLHCTNDFIFRYLIVPNVQLSRSKKPRRKFSNLLSRSTNWIASTQKNYWICQQKKMCVYVCNEKKNKQYPRPFNNIKDCRTHSGIKSGQCVGHCCYCCCSHSHFFHRETRCNCAWKLVFVRLNMCIMYSKTYYQQSLHLTQTLVINRYFYFLRFDIEFRINEFYLPYTELPNRSNSNNRQLLSSLRFYFAAALLYRNNCTYV